MTTTRAQLQQYFAKYCIPTQSNFTDLINGMLNQADDGIFKSAGDPLGIVAAGDATTSQKVLNLYANLSDPNPAWTLQLKPRSDPSDSTTAHSGFSISDATGTSRLFIDAGTYNVGIGTNTPQAVLDITGGANVGAGLTVSGSQVFIGQDSTPYTSDINTNSVICFAQAAKDEQNAGKIIYNPAWCPKTLSIVGSGGAGSRAIALWDNVTVENTLTIGGAATLNNTLTVSGSSNLAALTVSGAATLNNTLTVSGSSTLAALNVSGAVAINNTLTVSGAATLNTLTVSELSPLAALTVSGTSTLAALNVSGAATLNNTLTVSGSSFLTDIKVSGPVALYNTLTVSELSSLAALNVYGATTLNNLTVSGSTSVNSLTINGQTVYPKIAVIPDNHYQNGGYVEEYGWIIDITKYNFTTIYSAFVIFQGFSLFDDYNPGFSNPSDIPQIAYVKLGNYTTKKVSGVSYCSCANGNESNGSVMFTLVVIGI